MVIPAFNEADNLVPLFDELRRVTDALPYSFEFIIVDDGSTDDTLPKIERLASKDSRVRGLSLSRNFGHQAALTAGLDVARGDAVITMDGDLQHPPRFIPELLLRWKDGFGVVQTVREGTVGEPFLKRLTSKIFYGILNAFSETPVHPSAADFRLLDRSVVTSLQSMTERDRFLRGLISWVGFSSTTFPYRADARRAGTTKYSPGRMWKLAVDGLTSFSAAPLHAVGYLGIIVSILSFLYGAYSLYAYFFTNLTIPGWTSLLVAVLFLGGVQLISIGILGEYLLRVYNESKGRPLYIVKKTIGQRPAER